MLKTRTSNKRRSYKLIINYQQGNNNTNTLLKRTLIHLYMFRESLMTNLTIVTVCCNFLAYVVSNTNTMY